VSSVKRFLHVTRVLFRAGEREEARALLDQLLTRDPSLAQLPEVQCLEWSFAWEASQQPRLDALLEQVPQDCQWQLRALRSRPAHEVGKKEWVHFARRAGRTARRQPLMWAVLQQAWIQAGTSKTAYLKSILKRLPEFAARAHDWDAQWAIYQLEIAIAEQLRDFSALEHVLRRAHAHCLEIRAMGEFYEVLLGLARLARYQDRPSQAARRLALLKRTLQGEWWTRLRQKVEEEEHAAQEHTADWIVDAERGIIHTRERGEIVVGRQHVLLEILKALSRHAGLTKAEIIQRVWREIYRPEAHDNKLYYNINRLRKLIEPDMKAPRYVLNHASGYRLAPGLRVRLLHQESPRKVSGK
jgi:DNA-binding winged helix-turn-helix (wHTH) protein